MLADFYVGRPLDRFHKLHITALQLIQREIQDGHVDEGLAIAVLLIGLTNVQRGQFQSVRKHLRGLLLILQQIVPNFTSSKLSQTRLSSLTMQMWRLGIKLDWVAAMFTLQQPIFPPVPNAEEFHRPWITASTGPGDTAEWAIAALSLDNLIHRSCHLAYQIHAIRGESKNFEQELMISTIVIELENEIRSWGNRPFIRMAEALEKSVQNIDFNLDDSSDDSHLQFLDYPILRIKNSFYANLRLAWYGLSIYASLLASPYVGSAAYPQRFMSAVEICRTIAGGGNDVNQSLSHKFWTSFLAAIAFAGGDYPSQEAQWVWSKYREFARQFPMLSSFVIYQQLWILPEDLDFWDELESINAKVGHTQ